VKYMNIDMKNILASYGDILVSIYRSRFHLSQNNVNPFKVKGGPTRSP
jgi:hypothetical protein